VAQASSVNLPIGRKNSDLLLSLGVVVILAMMILPLPALLIDLLLATSIGASLVILFVALQSRRPVEFSTFPTVLLIATLFRLALNIATTRRILLHGGEGHTAAGQVVRAFGEVVVGGDYTVGLIIFTILVVINFVVITKGAGRIAEVAARFMLDAMPGKQISTDADLSAGLISEKVARQRRLSISREADFYGAMDGASKFVRGDAIAAILMIVINILGGLVIGIFYKGMGLADAARNYTLLTIGEGLAAQIPALIVSTAAGIIVTRATSRSNLSTELFRQFFIHPNALFAAAGIIGALGLMPNMPHFAMLTLALVLALLGYMAAGQKLAKDEDDIEETGAKKSEKGEGEGEEDEEEEGEGAAGGGEGDKDKDKKDVVIVPPDLIELNVGYGLINLVDEMQGGDLIKRVTAIRKQIGAEMGFVVPPVHVRDNLSIKPNEYLILIKGTEVSRGELLPGHHLAMSPVGGDAEIDGAVPGISTKEPCFGIRALWVTEADRDKAQMAGLTVVDLPSVIATHLTEMIRKYAHELLGRQEAQGLLDRFRKEGPKVVDELVPNLLPLGSVAKVLANLLRERVPIKDLRTILETLADVAPATKDVDQLTEYVRQALARTITSLYQAPDKSLPVMSLDPHLDQQVAMAIQQTPQGNYLALDPQLAQKMLVEVKNSSERLAQRGYPPVLLCSPMIRPHLRKLIERFLPAVSVISSNEVAPHVRLQSVEVVRVAGINQADERVAA
jgi:flagellar biosynthesis protein FlhA